MFGGSDEGCAFWTKGSQSVKTLRVQGVETPEIKVRYGARRLRLTSPSPSLTL